MLRAVFVVMLRRRRCTTATTPCIVRERDPRVASNYLPCHISYAPVIPDHQSTPSDRDNISVCCNESAGNTSQQDTVIVVQRPLLEIACQNAVTFIPECLSPPASAAGVKEKASHGVAKGTCGVQKQRHLAFQQGSRSESTCTAA